MFRREHFILFKFAFKLFAKESQGIAAITSKVKCYSDFFLLFWRIKDGFFVGNFGVDFTFRYFGEIRTGSLHKAPLLPTPAFVRMFRNVPATVQSY